MNNLTNYVLYCILNSLYFQNQYAANLETIMQLLRERDVQEAEWRRNEALERENLLNELSVQKRGKDFRFYGSRGKRPSLDYQKR
jgi:hypothetical protein